MSLKLQSRLVRIVRIAEALFINCGRYGHEVASSVTSMLHLSSVQYPSGG